MPDTLLASDIWLYPRTTVPNVTPNAEEGVHSLQSWGPFLP